MSTVWAPVRCATEAETLALGERIGSRVEPGDLILLSGELGAGKTVLVRGIATGMGIDPGDRKSVV
jgi:tRNA threonylcarbamoyladenosine biosynthesis protein TsaE